MNNIFPYVNYLLELSSTRGFNFYHTYKSTVVKGSYSYGKNRSQKPKKARKARVIKY